MGRKIAIIQGHPDPGAEHFCHALGNDYKHAAEQAGHSVRVIDVAKLDFPIMRTAEQFASKDIPADIKVAQEAILWAEHLLIIYPLWLGTMPALLKAFFEQTFRYEFAMEIEPGKMPRRLLKGRSARIVITMGMPGLIYRWYFGAHSLKSLERNVLGFCGVGPIRETLIGSVDTCGASKRQKWLDKMTAWGRQGV